ncbi:hypothetical protein ACSQ8B_15100 [Marinovum sp. F03]
MTEGKILRSVPSMTKSASPTGSKKIRGEAGFPASFLFRQRLASGALTSLHGYMHDMGQTDGEDRLTGPDGRAKRCTEDEAEPSDR